MGKSPEERLESRRVRELQKVIVKLKRELAQANKSKLKLERELEVRTDEDDESEEPVYQRPDVPNYCPKCGASPIVTFPLRGQTYFKCEANGCKGPLK